MLPYLVILLLLIIVTTHPQRLFVTSSQQHSFLNVIDTKRPLIALFKEVRASVTETMEPMLDVDKEETTSSVSCVCMRALECVLVHVHTVLYVLCYSM